MLSGRLGPCGSAPSNGKGPSHHAGTRERHQGRFERDEILKWNEEIPVYAHYRLTISGEHEYRIMEDLQLLNVTRENHFPGLDSFAKSVSDSHSNFIRLMREDGCR